MFMPQPESEETRLSHWFPRVAAAGLPVPRTEIVELEPAERDGVYAFFDGVDADAAVAPFLIRLAKAAANVGGQPVFLRTDHTSNKHEWRRSCHVTDVGRLLSHVLSIAEFSLIADLPIGTWAVRETLRTEPAFHAFGGGMPITREFRLFVDGAQVTHVQPYWPPGAFEHDTHVSARDWRERLFDLSRLSLTEIAQLLSLTVTVGKALPEIPWSVDWLWTDRGWVLTDMAAADRSFRWDWCRVCNEDREHRMHDPGHTGPRPHPFMPYWGK